jgi:hypothetical protein
MSLRKSFKTDKTIETRGIEVDYGTSIFTVARAGGSNKAYKKALAKALKPLRAAIEAENIDDERAQPALIKVFAENCMLASRTLYKGEWVDGIENPDGDHLEPLEVKAENFIKLFTELPELFRELQEKAIGRKLFLEDIEYAAKN